VENYVEVVLCILTFAERISRNRVVGATKMFAPIQLSRLCIGDNIFTETIGHFHVTDRHLITRNLLYIAQINDGMLGSKRSKINQQQTNNLRQEKLPALFVVRSHLFPSLYSV
jgi:hypothetical protein